MVKKPTILLVLPHAETDNFAESLVKVLSEFDFRVCAFNARNEDQQSSVWAESTLIRLSGLRWRDIPYQTVKLIRLIRELKPDVIHTTDYKCAIVVAAVKLLTFSKTPFLLNRHYNKVHHDLHKKHVYIDRLLQRIANCVVVVSFAQRDTVLNLEKGPKSKVLVIHNGVEIERLILDETHIRILRQEFREKSQYSLVAVGRIHSQKDYPTLIEALGYARGLGYDVHLYVCGVSNQSEQKILDHKIVNLGLKSHVTFLGYVENALNYIQASDVFVQSSMDEAFGISILEALFLRKRIAVTTPGGVIEFTSRFQEFLPPGDSQTLAQKITNQLDSLGSECPKCMEIQYQYLISNFEFKVTAAKYGSVYRSLLFSRVGVND